MTLNDLEPVKKRF